MGLDATVSCNCFKEGKTTAPPVPPEWLFLDSDGYWSCVPEHDSNEVFSKLYDWQRNCCKHKDMEYVTRHIANWAGYRLFQEALAKIGWDNFPTLQRELPNNNGGLMHPDAARQALIEIDRFRQVSVIGQNAVLVDTTTGFVIFEHVASYQGIFIFGELTGLEAGIGETEFFIRDKNSGEVRFRAVRVSQRLLDPVQENKWYDGRAEFLDLDKQQTFVCRIVVSGAPNPWPDGRIQDDEGRMRFNPSDAFHVEIRTIGPSHFDYAVNSLTELFEASVATGNPVRWC